MTIVPFGRVRWAHVPAGAWNHDAWPLCVRGGAVVVVVVVVVGFGGGLTWAAAVVKWVEEPQRPKRRAPQRWLRYQRARLGSWERRVGHVVDTWVETGSRMVEKQSQARRRKRE